jgi:hypothetical protein
MVDGQGSVASSEDKNMNTIINKTEIHRAGPFGRTGVIAAAIFHAGLPAGVRRVGLLTVGLILAACVMSAGCTAPQTAINVSAAADEAIRANLQADDELSTALGTQSQDLQAALNLIQKARQLSTGEIQVHPELEKTGQEVSRLLQTAFPVLTPVASPTGTQGGIKP